MRHIRDGSQTQRVYEFVRSEIDAGRSFPTSRAIADHMGWKGLAGPWDALNRLRVQGLLVVVKPNAIALHERYELAARIKPDAADIVSAQDELQEIMSTDEWKRRHCGS